MSSLVLPEGWREANWAILTVAVLGEILQGEALRDQAGRAVPRGALCASCRRHTQCPAVCLCRRHLFRLERPLYHAGVAGQLQRRLPAAARCARTRGGGAQGRGRSGPGGGAPPCPTAAAVQRSSKLPALHAETGDAPICKSQESKLALLWTVGIFALNCGPVIMGFVLDFLGPKFTGILGEGAGASVPSAAVECFLVQSLAGFGSRGAGVCGEAAALRGPSRP